jgi:hypothetical protein
VTFTDHEGDVMSISVLPSVDPNMFVSGSCDTLAKVLFNYDYEHLQSSFFLYVK